MGLVSISVSFSVVAVSLVWVYHIILSMYHADLQLDGHSGGSAS